MSEPDNTTTSSEKHECTCDYCDVDEVPYSFRTITLYRHDLYLIGVFALLTLALIMLISA